MGDEEPSSTDQLIDRLVGVIEDDQRVVASLLGGSRARGRADTFSDVDVSVILADTDYEDVLAEKAAFVRQLGDPLFIEDFGQRNMALVVFADGVELDLFFFPEHDVGSIRPGMHQVLVDPSGLLAEIPIEDAEVDRDAQADELRRILSWFWHDVGHFTTAIGRGQLWWAAGQLEQLRHYCVNLVRIEQSSAPGDEAYWKLDVEISTGSLEALRATFVPIERDAMLDAGRRIVAFFRERAPEIARANDVDYPADLADLVTGHLEELPGSSSG